jgi:hypothetical protein
MASSLGGIWLKWNCGCGGFLVEVGKRYLIIYDDKGNRPVKKIGTIISEKENLITLDSGEILNKLFIIRAEAI